jgi:hypothetical protein
VDETNINLTKPDNFYLKHFLVWRILNEIQWKTIPDYMQQYLQRCNLRNYTSARVITDHKVQ